MVLMVCTGLKSQVVPLKLNSGPNNNKALFSVQEVSSIVARKALPVWCSVTYMTYLYEVYF